MSALRLESASWALAALLLAAAAHPCVAQTSVATAPTERARAKAAGRSTPGKPQPPISVGYRLSAVPAVGEELLVTITARADPGLGALTLEVRPDDGVSVPSPPLAVPAAGPGERAWQVRATPLVAGAARLNVLVTAAAGTGPPARGIVVPVDTAARGRSAALQVAGSGERILALPAHESPAQGSP